MSSSLYFKAFVVLAILLIAEEVMVDAQSAANTPGFMTNFMATVANSGAFSAVDDISEIGNNIMTSMELMGQGARMMTKAMLQALNMAFASSVAEIAVAEEGGASTDAKISAIQGAIQGAFLQTTGSGKK